MEQDGSRGPVWKVNEGQVPAREAPCRSIRELVSGKAGGARGVTLRIVEIHPHTRCQGRTPHAHADMEEVIYVLEGQGEMWVGGQRLPVGPGDAVLVPAGVAHMTVNPTSRPLRLACFFPSPDAGRGWREFPEWTQGKEEGANG